MKAQNTQHFEKIQLIQNNPSGASRLIPSFSESFIRFSISPPTSLPSLFGGRFITARFCAFGTARFRRQLRCHAVRALCFSCGLPHFIGEALHFSFAEGVFYRKRNRVLTGAFPYEHSIFLFYVQVRERCVLGKTMKWELVFQFNNLSR